MEPDSKLPFVLESPANYSPSTSDDDDIDEDEEDEDTIHKDLIEMTFDAQLDLQMILPQGFNQDLDDDDDDDGDDEWETMNNIHLKLIYRINGVLNTIPGGLQSVSDDLVIQVYTDPRIKQQFWANLPMLCLWSNLNRTGSILPVIPEMPTISEDTFETQLKDRDQRLMVRGDKVLDKIVRKRIKDYLDFDLDPEYAINIVMEDLEFFCKELIGEVTDIRALKGKDVDVADGILEASIRWMESLGALPKSASLFLAAA